jgi:putative ABC transport system permease protein
VLSEGVVLGAAGVFAGLPLTWIGTRFLASLLYGVSPRSQSEFAGAALMLLALTMTATLIPARRASRTNPATVLRAE